METEPRETKSPTRPLDRPQKFHLESQSKDRQTINTLTNYPPVSENAQESCEARPARRPVSNTTPSHDVPHLRTSGLVQKPLLASLNRRDANVVLLCAAHAADGVVPADGISKPKTNEVRITEGKKRWKAGLHQVDLRGYSSGLNFHRNGAAAAAERS